MQAGQLLYESVPPVPVPKPDIPIYAVPNKPKGRATTVSVLPAQPEPHYASVDFDATPEAAYGNVVGLHGGRVVARGAAENVYSSIDKQATLRSAGEFVYV